MRRPLRSVPATFLLLAACSGGGTQTPSPGGDLGPALTVERFLRASAAVNQMSKVSSANPQQQADEIETMAKLFGTADGSVLQLYPRDEVEQRMFLLARILDHSDYRILGARAVPGRGDRAVEVTVALTTRERPRMVNVPFIVVRAKQGDWLIERIDIEKVTDS